MHCKKKKNFSIQSLSILCFLQETTPISSTFPHGHAAEVPHSSPFPCYPPCLLTQLPVHSPALQTSKSRAKAMNCCPFIINPSQTRLFGEPLNFSKTLQSMQPLPRLDIAGPCPIPSPCCGSATSPHPTPSCIGTFKITGGEHDTESKSGILQLFPSLPLKHKSHFPAPAHSKPVSCCLCNPAGGASSPDNPTAAKTTHLLPDYSLLPA